MALAVGLTVGFVVAALIVGMLSKSGRVVAGVLDVNLGMHMC